MRMSDWSSDVCSSDLFQRPRRLVEMEPLGPQRRHRHQPVPANPRHGSEKAEIGDAGDPGLHHLSDVLGEKGGDIAVDGVALRLHRPARSEEHTSELQSLMRISYAVFCLNKKQKQIK